jgi:hypothetical protein
VLLENTDLPTIGDGSTKGREILADEAENFTADWLLRQKSSTIDGSLTT